MGTWWLTPVRTAWIGKTLVLWQILMANNRKKRRRIWSLEFVENAIPEWEIGARWSRHPVFSHFESIIWTIDLLHVRSMRMVQRKPGFKIHWNLAERAKYQFGTSRIVETGFSQPKPSSRWHKDLDYGDPTLQNRLPNIHSEYEKSETWKLGHIEAWGRWRLFRSYRWNGESVRNRRGCMWKSA
jgi:hypothetical protein